MDSNNEGLENKIGSKIISPLENIVNYVYAGIVPNVLGTFCGYNAIEQASEGRYGNALFSGFASVFNYLIGFSKFKEYRHVKKELKSGGWHESKVKRKMYSWCQRHAARQAAKQTGYLAEFDAFAKREGHKWYHLLPKMGRAFDELRNETPKKQD